MRDFRTFLSELEETYPGQVVHIHDEVSAQWEAEMHERRAERIKPVVVSRSDAPVKEVVKTGEAVNAREVPALVHAAWDPGPYIPTGFLTTYDPDTEFVPPDVMAKVRLEDFIPGFGS